MLLTVMQKIHVTKQAQMKLRCTENHLLLIPEKYSMKKV